MKRKALIFGATGQVGAEVRRLFLNDYIVRCPSRHQVDFLKPDSIVRAISEFRPDLIINAAAFTNVDAAELDEFNATQINAMAPGIIASEAKQISAKLIHYSTDYVFDGHKTSPYLETDLVAPLNNYGRSKALGESIVRDCADDYVILRLSWVYGQKGQNFFNRVSRSLENNEVIHASLDQTGSPTWSKDIAYATKKISSDIDFESKSGLYHLSAGGYTTRYEFAAKIISEYSMNGSDTASAKLLVSQNNFSEKSALRPKNCVLDASKIFQTWKVRLPYWSDSLLTLIDDIRRDSAI